ncbi:MAG TPA: hypothetical protein VES88_15075 [Gemmatimonadaceae bacterium]|nr:hypothetical protein [Gemmatimonadaceae bacterium]
MLAQFALAVLAVAGPRAEIAKDAASDIEIRVDSVKHEISVTVGPMSIPVLANYEHHGAETYVNFRWPVSGWVKGYRIDVVDSAGALMPRELLHHAGMANLDRRQLAYPLAERLFAAGRETTPVMLPGSMGLPLDADQKMSFYYMLMNETGKVVHGARLRVTLTWIPAETKGVKNILPLLLNANGAGYGPNFDMPSGVSSTTAEFTLAEGGRVRTMGGHMHDYAREIRLEDVATGKVLVRLEAKRARGGQVEGMERTNFLTRRHGLRLSANRRYRVVAVYDNPTGKAISGAMGLMVGAFTPDNLERWPAIDSADPAFQRDLASLDENRPAPVHVHRH